MNLKSHLTASFIISAVILLIFKSWPLTIASFIAGVFIDLDHWWDFIYHRGFSLSPQKFFAFFREHALVKGFVLLHAWEWLALLCAVSWYSNWNPWLTGVFIGMSHHMIFDQIFNVAKPLSYFITYRIINGFDFLKSFDRAKINRLRNNHEAE